MKKTLLSSSKETKTFIIVTIVLTLIFAFNDNKQSFVFLQWFSNFLYTLILVIITLSIHILGIKLASSYFKQDSRFKLWDFTQFLFAEKRHFKKPLPIGIFVSLLITLMSNGAIFFTAISTFQTSHKKTIGRKFPNISEREIALIGIYSLLANLILLIIFKLLGIQQGLLINSWFILWNLLPISDLIGSQIFFGSRTLYFFSLFFILLFLLFISTLNIFSTVILVLLFTAILTVIYFRYIEYKASTK